MSDEDLKPLLAELLRKTEQIILTQHDHGRRMEEISHWARAVDGDIRELKGQQTIMLQWLQSMDQRFGALMVPINPPKKAG